MRDAVIVEAVRTPVGKRNGGLSGVHPVDLSAHVLEALASAVRASTRRWSTTSIWGCVSQVGEQTFDIARNAVLAAGWPETVTGVTLDRQCGSSQQSVHFAAAGLVAGQYDVVVAGGVESMSRVPMGSSVAGADPFGAALRRPLRRRAPQPGRRRRDDRRAVGPLAHAARRVLGGLAREGRRRPGRGPVRRRRSRRSPRPTAPWSSQDEGIRRGSHGGDAGRRSRPCSSRGRRDHRGQRVADLRRLGRAADDDVARRPRELGLTPIARVHTAVLAGADPVIMLTAPIPATQKALARSRACRSTTSARSRSTRRSRPCRWPGWPSSAPTPKALNPNGGAIALGHPLGGSGARLMTTLVHHMRDNGIRYGLQTMCEGGGQANATILELL